MTHKVCIGCSQEKELIEFYSPIYSRCKKCHSQIVIENQRKRVDHYSKYRKEYAKQNRERVNRWQENFKKRFPETHSGKTYTEYYLEKRAARLAADPERKEKLREKNKKARQRHKAKMKKLHPNRSLINKASTLAKALLKFWSKNQGLN